MILGLLPIDKDRIFPEPITVGEFYNRDNELCSTDIDSKSHYICRHGERIYIERKKKSGIGTYVFTALYDKNKDLFFRTKDRIHYPKQT